MEFAVLLLFTLLAAALVALPGGGDPIAAEAERIRLLRAERETLLTELRELDEDAAAGRISAADRAAGRRELAPRLRAVTEALDEPAVRAGATE